MAEQLLNRLINAVETFSSNNSIGSATQGQRGNQPSQSNSVEDAVRRLYPSVDSGSRCSTTNMEQSVNANAAARDPDRTYVSRINTFVPSNSYHPGKGKRRMAQNRGQKRKAEVGKSKPPTLKDVILLPSPTIKEVPRGWKREELYDKNFAVSAVEISEGMDESQIREKLNVVFGEKLLHIPQPKFEFVRSVGNKIIVPGCQNYNGKIVKHLSRQGPLYIRSTQDIVTGMDLLKAEPKDESGTVLADNEEVNDEEIDMDSDDDILMISPFPSCTPSNYPPTSSSLPTESSLIVTHSSVPGHILTSSTTASENTISRRQESVQQTISSNEQSCVVTAVMVTCPTCNNSFSTDEIAEHADICAEAASDGLQSGVTYGNLVMQDISISPLDMDTVTKDKDITLKECLETLQANIQAERSRLYVRRKLLWEDFVNVTKNCKWFQPTNTLKIIFVGEPAVDGGGPKREFFTETLDQMKIRLFEDGVPVASTISLTEGYFKAAGMLMACSIVQGGPAPNFMAKWVFDYIAYGLHEVPLCTDDIHNELPKKVAEKISSAKSDHEMQEIICDDEVLTVLNSIGYRGVPSRESLRSKEKLIRSICIKELITPIIPVLKDLEEGLQYFGLLCQVKKHPDLFKQLFTPSSQYTVTAENFLDNLMAIYSEQQLRKSKEDDIFKYFTDFILALYHAGINEAPDMKLKHVLKFITGTDQIPPLGFPSLIKVHFLHGCNEGCKCRPTSSTCFLTLTLPIHTCNSDELGELLISAINDCCGFGAL